MKEMTMIARAKINLLLSVLNRREDGYHNILSLMQMVDFGDEVTVACTKESGIVLESNRTDLPTDSGNIAYRAAALMKETFGLEGGFKITLKKSIPVAAGLAGGSTNAAAVMHLINRLCALNLSFEELAELGVTLGADVPFCLYGRPALCEGIGERLTPVSGLSDCYIVLANPGVAVSTAMIYQALDGKKQPRTGDADKLIRALSERKLAEAFCEMKNVMEPVATEFCPEIATLLAKLKEAGAEHVMMSGSGATCFGIFKEKPDEETVKRLLGAAFVAVTRPVL